MFILLLAQVTSHQESDGRSSWRKLKLPSTSTLNDIYFVDSDNGWAVGSEGTILKTADGGSTWSVARNGGKSELLTSMRFKSRDEGWAVGGAFEPEAGWPALFLRTLDGGNTWSKIDPLGIPLGPIGPLRIQWVSNKWGFILGSRVIYTDDGGSTWFLSRDKAAFDASGIVFCDERNGWAIDSKSPYFTNDHGETWKEAKGEWLPAEESSKGRWDRLFALNKDQVWLIRNDGNVIGTNDGGKHWRWLGRIPHGLIRDIWFVSATKGWAASYQKDEEGKRGILWNTDDGGKTWKGVASGTEEVRRIFFRNESEGWAVGKGVVLKYDPH